MSRPVYKPTAATRRRVAIAAGAGMSHEEIALGLGISRPTLEKHFEHELSTGAYAKRLEILNAMHRTAKKGNVAAQKAYLLLAPRAAAPPQPAAGAKKPEGKKAEAQAAALTAGNGTEWEGLLNRPATPTH